MSVPEGQQPREQQPSQEGRIHIPCGDTGVYEPHGTPPPRTERPRNAEKPKPDRRPLC